MKTMTVLQIAEMVGGEIVGDANRLVVRFAPLEQSDAQSVSFLAKAKMSELLQTSGAGVVLVPKGVVACEGKTLIVVRDPYLASAIVHGYLLESPFIAEGIHPRAVVAEDARLPEAITVGPLAVIGKGVEIGERVTIEAGAVIGDRVKIGDDCLIAANAVIYKECQLGRRVTIHAGAVIGCDGYGYAANEKGQHIKRPQVGIVRIDDDVEVGANACIDRATFGVTWVKAGTKIDNLVQVGHNVEIGENCLIVAQTGLSGSTVLGTNVVMGGQSASAGHLKVGDRTMIAARGAVHNDQPVGAVVGGTPAIPIRQWAKSSAVFARLPELQSKVRENAKAIAELAEKVEKRERGVEDE